MKNKLLGLFGLIFLSCIFVFANSVKVSANDTVTINNYARFQVTINDVILHPYSCDYNAQTCTLDTSKSKTVNLVFETVAPNIQANSSSGGTHLSSDVTKNLIMFDSFEVLSFNPDYAGSQTKTVLMSDMRMYELYNLLSKFAHDFGVVYTMQDVVENNDSNYIIPNMIFMNSRNNVTLYNYALDVSNRSEIQPLYYQLADIFNNGSNVVNLSDIDYENGYNQGFSDGESSVDITTDNQNAIDNYIEENNLHTDSDYIEYGNSKYNDGYVAGQNSVDITVDNEESYNNGYSNGKSDGIEEGKASVDITTDNESAINKYIQDNNLHTDSDYIEYGNSKYNDGFTAGQESIDVTVDNEDVYTDGFNDGKQLGIAEGKASVDITTDNQTAIENYINQNNLKTLEEYNNYGDSKYNLGFNDGKASVDITSDNEEIYNNAYSLGYSSGKSDGIEIGKASVDITTDNNDAIQNYIKENNLHTDSDYINYGISSYQDGYNRGKQDGIDSVDITSDNESVYNQGYNDGKLSVDITVDNQEHYDLGYQNGYTIGYNDGKSSVDITIDNEEIYNNGFADGVGSVDITTDNKEAYNNGYETGYKIGYDNGQASIDIESIRQDAYNNGFNEGVISVDITIDNESVYNSGYSDGYDYGYTLGFYEGKASIDVEQIKKDAYNNGYDNGYNVGFADGEYSVDITSDNDTVIKLFIEQNKYHSDYDFNLNFDLGYSAGIKFVYDNLDNDKTVTKYVKDYIYLKKYYTNTEYINNYNLGYQTGYSDGYNYGYDSGIVDGKEVIYKNITSDPIVKEYYKEKIINNTKIEIIEEGTEKVYVIKNYIINETDTGDFRVIIQYGQDTYKIETVENVIPGENNNTIIEKDNSEVIGILKDIGVAIGVFFATILVIVLLKGILNVASNRKNFKYDESYSF